MKLRPARVKVFFLGKKKSPPRPVVTMSLSGMVFACTGKSDLTRAVLTKKIKDNGGTFASSITKKVHKVNDTVQVTHFYRLPTYFVVKGLREQISTLKRKRMGQYTS